MDEGLWQPRCEPPGNLVWPVRLDPTGRDGPTRGQARSKRWRRAGHGWYVDTSRAGESVEQYILEQAAKVSVRGVVTGWAALRWHGAAYFDGTTNGGRDQLEVPLIRLTGRYPEGADWRRHIIGQNEQEIVRGMRCASVQRALFDEMRFSAHVDAAVVAMEMTAAAGLISTWLMTMYVAQRAAWEGVPLVRDALMLSGDHSRSPQETRMKLVWVCHAGLPYPLVNQPVFDLSGTCWAFPTCSIRTWGWLANTTVSPTRAGNGTDATSSVRESSEMRAWSTSRSWEATCPTPGWSSTGCLLHAIELDPNGFRSGGP